MKDKKMNFPRLVFSNWFDLRRKIQENPGMSVTPKSISDALNLTVGSVYANIFPALRHFELVDNSGNLTELGKDWADDDKYKDICLQLIENTYPVELINDIHDPINNRSLVTEWFLRKTNSKMNIIQQMTSTYLLLCKADASYEPHEKKPLPKPVPPVLKLRKKRTIAVETKPEVAVKEAEIVHAPSPVAVEPAPVEKQAVYEAKSTTQPRNPQININVQIKISSDISLEQIDMLFSGMGKYLVGR